MHNPTEKQMKKSLHYLRQLKSIMEAKETKEVGKDEGT